MTAIVTKHLMLSFQPANRIFSHKLFVFPFEGMTLFAVLQSRVHVSWAWLLSSTLEERLNYSVSECFETFPFPNPDPRTVIPTLEAAGQALYDARARFMVDTDQGLTKTYNALKDPACDDPRILELRRLHEAMDRAVLGAYGWTDIEVPSYCPKSDAERVALQVFEDEVIDRIYLLNAERAREEQRLGTPKEKKVAPSKGAPTKKAARSDSRGGQGELYFAEVHHAVPLSSYEEEGAMTDVRALVVVCANCHRMLHRRRPWLLVETALGVGRLA